MAETKRERRMREAAEKHARIMKSAREWYTRNPDQGSMDEEGAVTVVPGSALDQFAQGGQTLPDGRKTQPATYKSPNGYVTATPNQEPELPGIEALMAPQPGYNFDPGFRPRIEDPDGGGTLDPIGGYVPGTVPGQPGTVWQDPTSGAIYSEPPPPGQARPNVPPISSADIPGNAETAARFPVPRGGAGPGGSPYQPLGQATGLPAALGGRAPALDLEALAGAGPSTPFHWSQAEYMPAWGEAPLPDMERAALPRQQLALPTMGQPQLPTMPVQRPGPISPGLRPPQNPAFGPPAQVRGQRIPDYIGNPPLDDNALDEILGQLV